MTNELEQRLCRLEQLVLRAAAQSNVSRDQLEQLAPLTPLPPKPKAKAKPKPKPKAKPDITPQQPKLQVLEGALEPLSNVLRGLKATKKSLGQYSPLLTIQDVLERPAIKGNVGVKAENVRRTWATILHLRADDDEGFDPQAARGDLADFRRWARDPQFVRMMNLDPSLAVCWFVDTLLAANGDLWEEDQD
jgi:hypothetical protein